MESENVLKDLTFEFQDMQGQDRLRQLILYIANKCENNSRFGMTKLVKILYFADFESYRQRGKPITGLAYIKQPYGPVPEPFFTVRDSMVGKDIVIRTQATLGDREQQRVIAMREPDLSLFSAEDIAIVDQVIELVWKLNAEQVSNMSHGLAWLAAKDKERIPYQAAYINDNITSDDLAMAKFMANEYKGGEYKQTTVGELAHAVR